MVRSIRLAAAALAALLMLAACGGGPPPDEGLLPEEEQRAREQAASEAASEPAGGATEEAAALNTECQVELPAEGEGSAQGMTDDPVATAASNNPAVSTLVAAVTQAGLVDTLNDTSTEFTVFAPSNDAFAKIPEADLNALLANQEQLTSILTLHVVPGQRLSAEELAAMGTVPTVNGQEITLAVEGGNLMVNGQASVICPNVQTANATVHIIDTVLTPSG